jgi:tetratricopeptide (TPR) repeat protein
MIARHNLSGGRFNIAGRFNWDKAGVRILCALLLCAVANGASAEVDDDQLEPTQDLKSLNKKGADGLRFRFHKDETFWLQGIKAGKIVWQKKFPVDGTVNEAKTTVKSEGQQISVISEQPFSALQYIYRFSWDGVKLTYLGESSEDPTEEAIAKATDAALKGNPNATKFASDACAYSDRYIDGSVISSLLEQGHKAALKLYKEGKKQDAQSRLKLVFDTSYVLITMRGELSDADEKKKDVEKWLAGWHLESIGLQADAFTHALNDYGFFLQENGKDKEAKQVFDAVLEEDNDLSVAHLNLADSLYNLGNLAEAKENYKTYINQIAKTRDANKIPTRAYERAGLPVPTVVNNAKPKTTAAVSKSKPHENDNSPDPESKKYGPDYVAVAVEQPGLRWNSEHMPVNVFIDESKAAIGFREEFVGDLKDAFKAWEVAAGGPLKFKFVDSEKAAQIKCSWSNNSADMIDVTNEGGQAAVEPSKDGMQTATIILKTRNSAGLFSEKLERLVCLHEVGHALGLTGHSPYDRDVMYGGIDEDGPTKLSARDVATIRKIYSDPRPVDLTNYINASAINRQGIQMVNSGDNMGALKKFQEAVALSPNLRPAKQNLGHQYYSIACDLMKEGKNVEADRYFQQAISYNKTGYRRQLYVETLEKYSELLSRMGHKKEAEEMSTEAFGVKSGLLD